MAADEPKWRRRKEARPGEILAAALTVFAESGFAAARLDEIARRAGVSKAALYRYFETKEELFRAVVRSFIAPDFDAIGAAVAGFDGSFAAAAPILLAQAAALIGQGPLPAVVRMVIGESRTFPDLARIWHDDVLAPLIAMVADLVARAQARGEVRPGDPRLHAMSLMAPMLMALLFREVFTGIAADPPDLAAVAAQHAHTALSGLLLPAPAAKPIQPRRI